MIDPESVPIAKANSERLEERTHKPKPRPAERPSGARDSGQWAWVDSNYRPHAYQAWVRGREWAHSARHITRHPRMVRATCTPLLPLSEQPAPSLLTAQLTAPSPPKAGVETP